MVRYVLRIRAKRLATFVDRHHLGGTEETIVNQALLCFTQMSSQCALTAFNKGLVRSDRGPRTIFR